LERIDWDATPACFAGPGIGTAPRDDFIFAPELFRGKILVYENCSLTRERAAGSKRGRCRRGKEPVTKLADSLLAGLDC
jgi:hypothetical protein